MSEWRVTSGPGFWYSSYTWLTRTERKARDEIRHLLRAPAPAAVGAGQRVPAPPGLARADRAGRPARVRLRVGGGAPLPRGVLALVRARGLPGRGEPADDADPARPRHHPAPHQSSDPRGRARRHPRSPERGTRGARTRRGAGAHRAPSVRAPGARQARRVGRSGEG